MEKILLLILLLPLISLNGFAQNPQEYSKGIVYYKKEMPKAAGPKVIEKEELMSNGAHNAFTIDVQDGNLEFVSRIWKDYTNSRFNTPTKYDKKRDEFITKNALVTPVTTYPINLFSKAVKLADKVRFTLWLDLDGAYLGSQVSPQKAEEVQAILEDFATQVQKEKFRFLLNQEKQNLEKLEMHLHRLKKTVKKHEYELEHHDSRKDRLEKNLDEIGEDQFETKRAIEKSKLKIEQLRDKLQSI